MTPRIRVAQVVTRFAGGAGGVVLRGARALPSDVFEATILTGEESPLVEDARQAGIEVVLLEHLVPRLDPLADARALRGLARIFSRSDYDIVHTHSSKAGAIGRLAARRAGVSAVAHTFHGFPFHEFQSMSRRGAYVSAERWLARITDHFFSVGSAVAVEAIRRRIVPAERVSVIEGAVDETSVTVDVATRRAARAALGIPLGARVVGTVARLDEQKAPHDFVAAIDELRSANVFAVWVGDGPLRASVRRDIARRGLDAQFVLLGERTDVAEILPAFDVFALASLYEGLPCAVVEAMKSGLPVVATAVNSVPEVVIPGRTGLLVAPRRPKDLARAIGYVLDAPGEARRLGAAGQALVAERFTEARLGADLAETYGFLLGLGGSGDLEHPLESDAGPLGRVLVDGDLIHDTALHE
jgi:glycosyltransferase involved in cell wall biosynthesis